MAHAANTRLLIKRSRTGRVTNDGTASAWEPGGLMARGLRTRGIDTPSGWPRAQRRPGRRGRPATACAHALPTATPSPRAVRGWGRARAPRAGKAGCPGLPLATGRPAPACCRPGHGGHVASGWRAVTPELPAWLLEHSIRLLRPPGGRAAGPWALPTPVCSPREAGAPVAMRLEDARPAHLGGHRGDAPGPRGARPPAGPRRRLVGCVCSLVCSFYLSLGTYCAQR